MSAKKIFKIVWRVFLLALVAGGLFFANAFFGNPLSKHLATQKAEGYLKSAYGDTDFYIERVGYNFKDGNYYAHIASPTSIDSKFALYFDWLGRLKYDSYENRVLDGSNTLNRINMEYRALVDTLLEDPDFPYYPLHIGYGELLHEYDEKNGAVMDIGGQGVVIDGVYDIYALGKTHGHLVIYVEDDIVTPERMTEILWDIKTCLDDAGIPFYSLNMSLWHPKDEKTSQRPEGDLDMLDFLYSDITEEGLLEKVQANIEATDAYYAALDAQKNKQ